MAPSYVQSCITAVGLPRTLDELADMVHKNSNRPGALTDVDCLLRFRPSHDISWTAPRWITQGDLLFFYHTRSARLNALHLERQFLHGPPASRWLGPALERAVSQAVQYSQTIFACALVAGRSWYQNGTEGAQHFRSRIFAPLGRVIVFEVPLPSADFTRVVTLSPGGTLTPVHGQSLDELKALLSRHNILPAFLRNARPGAMGFRNVTRANWPAVVTAPGRVFIDESQLRAYLLNFLLAELKDPRTKVFEECECSRSGSSTGIADYFVCVHGQWVPVEAKLNVNAERDLAGQLRKYLYVDGFRPRRGPKRGEFVSMTPAGVSLVADQTGIYTLVDGDYAGCAADRPAWSRATLSHDTAARIRASLANIIRALGTIPSTH